MFCAYTRPIYQVCVYTNIGPLVTICGHGGRLGHVTWAIYTNFRSPFPRRILMKFGFDRSSGFRGEDVSTL